MSSHLNLFLKICLLTCLRSKINLFFPDLFTETDKGFINSGASGNSTIQSSSDNDLIASSTNEASFNADLLLRNTLGGGSVRNGNL